MLRGDLGSAERRLREVRDSWDELEKKSLSEASLSMLTDDQRLAYAGEDYENPLNFAVLLLLWLSFIAMFMLTALRNLLTACLPPLAASPNSAFLLGSPPFDPTPLCKRNT